MTGMLKRVCLRARYQARNVNVVARRQKMVVRATREREVAGNRQNPCGFIAPCFLQERCAARSGPRPGFAIASGSERKNLTSKSPFPVLARELARAAESTFGWLA
jgi:hypothetical protein